MENQLEHLTVYSSAQFKICLLFLAKIYQASASSQGMMLGFVYKTEEACHHINYSSIHLLILLFIKLTAERLKASTSNHSDILVAILPTPSNFSSFLRF